MWICTFGQDVALISALGEDWCGQDLHVWAGCHFDRIVGSLRTVVHTPTPPPCLRGPLKDKTVVLVTNALQYLPFANNILWIDGGIIRAQGDYREQLKQGGGMQQQHKLATAHSLRAI